MLKGKKALILFLTLTMALATLGGCKNSGTAKTADDSNGPKPTLKALVVYVSGMDYNNYPAQKYLEEKTGYKVQYDTLPADSPNDKLNAIMAAGEDYDFIQVQDKSEYANFAEQGALTDLKPLIKKYGPNISKNVSSALFTIATVNNTYYGVPTMSPTGRKDTGNASMGILVRQDLLDQLGLSMPTTIGEFENMLQQVKDKDPNKQGANNIPLTTDNTIGLSTSGIGGAFGIATGWAVSDNKLVPDVEMPGFKSYITFMRDLYSKGLIDKEAPTNTGATAKEKFTSGKAFSFICGWYDIPTIITTLQKTQPNAKVKYLSPVSGEFGKGAQPAASQNAIDYYDVIPKTSKHAQDVIKFFNSSLEADTFKNLVLGTEGTDYTVKNNAYYPVLPAFFNDRGNANHYMAGATKDYSTYWLCRLHKDENLYEGWKELNMDYGNSIVVDPTADLPSSVYSTVANTQLALNTLKNQFVVQSVAGSYSDSTYNQFLSKWKAQGGDLLVKTINDWYKTTKKSK